MSEVLRTTCKLLFFRITREELLCMDFRHLAFGLLCTWLVGIGRFWDHPNAKLFQYLGLGSVIYVFALSLFLWLFIWPLRPKNWSYRSVLTFITLVSPPAALYALPVERWFSLETATSLNKWFLLVVATWRVALLVFFVKRFGELKGGEVFVATVSPLAAIVLTLSSLKLDQRVFQMMGGFDRSTPTAEDDANAILFLLTFLSSCFALPLLIAYVGMVAQKWVDRRSQASPAEPEQKKEM
ncbi:MAG TPA: hypothetical protein PLD20_26300 [Blastocatellia bacterium]|nr:hypothetical protein [Blastocatellia bacterium]HMX28042.1 hypothetical protein [Blastocatellia bacterium]HMY71841.1 hypothetical protein [Blastocatellia bacterium]HMZ21472.1 hypothetical protein [Blastocatellia bacterium]HNG32613.1 hypothetical protein [Blastocatellia bacterium]